MKIAGNEVLANPAHWAAFPPSWRTLYELTKLPPKVLEAKIIDGVITPRIERKGVVSPKNEITAHGKAPSTTDTTEKKAPPSRRQLAKEVEAQRAHIEELQAARENPTEFAPADAEKMRRLEIENRALKSEIEELKAERDALHARVAELERELEAAKTGGGAPIEKRKRGRPRVRRTRCGDEGDRAPRPSELRLRRPRLPRLYSRARQARLRSDGSRRAITWRFSNAARSGNRNHAGAIMSAPSDFVFGNKKMPGHTNAPGSFNRDNINACITAPEAAQWEF
jgi:hypothetical protein